MKKIFIILLCMITLNANATEMCARNDTVVIPLDATISGKYGGNSTIEWLWWLIFDYGTVYGASTCLSKKEIMMYSDWNGTGNTAGGNLAAVTPFLNTSSDELIGSQDYYMNANVNPDIPDSEKPDYERIYCFFKMTHPMSSPWVFSWNIGTASNCAAQCRGVNLSPSNYVDTRRNLFNTVGTVPPWTE